jgi:CPA2 family monovalent cation:H+ antiporter-2
LIFRTIDPIENWLRSRPRLFELLERRADLLARRQFEHDGRQFHDHAVICGWGRVGSVIGQLLEGRGFPVIVIDQSRRQVEELRRRGIAAFYGDAGNHELLAHANLPEARVLVIAVPDPRATRQIVEYVQRLNPRPDIIARTHREREWCYLRDRVSLAVLGEREAALQMAQYTLSRFGFSAEEVQGILTHLRQQTEMERIDREDVERAAEPASPAQSRT